MGSKERSWFERQSHTLGVQEALLWSELRGSRKVTPKKVYLIGQCSDGFTGADLTTADPGPDLARLEDSHWRNKVSQEVQRIEPDLFVVLFQCTGVSPLSLASSNWLTQLVTEQKGCVLVLDEVSSRRWEDLEGLEFEDGRHLEMYYARGTFA